MELVLFFLAIGFLGFWSTSGWSNVPNFVPFIILGMGILGAIFLFFGL